MAFRCWVAPVDLVHEPLEVAQMTLRRGRARRPGKAARTAGSGPDDCRRGIAENTKELGGLQMTLAGNSGGAGGSRIKADNVVWIFGFGRSGSTWLSSMMGEMEDHTVWLEPGVGALFGNFYYEDPWIGEAHRTSPLFILGSRRAIWLRLIRSFVLDGALAMFPEAGNYGPFVVKEPYGSIGAPLLMEALPESRMILLVRDPRDVVASSLDAFEPGSWGSNALGVNSVPDFNTEDWANLYLRTVGKATQAYEAHEGGKVLVRYEDLRVDTLRTMKRIYSTLQISVDEENLGRVVDKNSWDNLPDRSKGPGRFYRKGTPGGWKEDLTAEQVETVERVTAPIIKGFYS